MGQSTYTGTAIFGETSPFNTSADKALAARMRTRTYTTPFIDEYATSQTSADAAALVWLKEKYREFRPLKVTAVRPDAWIRQTVKAVVNNLGINENYYIKEVRRSAGPICEAVLVAYRV